MADDFLQFTFIDHPAPTIRALALPLDGAYLERCWCHIVGPTGVGILRFVHWIARGNTSIRIDLVELAAVLGVRGKGQNAPLWRSIGRLARWGLVEWEESEVGIYRQVAPLHPRQLTRAPELVREAHDMLTASGGTGRGSSGATE